MKRSCLIFLRSAAVGGIVVPGLLMSTFARAQSQADAALNGYNSAYLVQANGQTYYADTLTSVGTHPQAEWGGALAITVAEDAYQHDHSQAKRDLVISLLNSLAYYNAPGSLFGNWQTDGWDDNLAWMVNAFLRGYELTGVSSYLTQAENGWNNGYNQGWDTTVAGGGIWENTDKGSKCALSNDPFVFEGVQLYQATGNSTYLSRAETIYGWVRSTLFKSSSSSNVPGNPGQVHGCVGNTGALQSTTDHNVYDSGAFVKAATDLYRVTQNQMYHDDALLAINYVLGEGSVLHDSNNQGNQWAYWFTRGLSDFATETNSWGTYQSYLQNNANAAWSERSNLNITWNDWTAPTNDTGKNTGPMDMSSAAAIWQHLLPPSVNVSGRYEIQNVASGMALNVSGASTADSAPIIQWPFTSGATNALWTFVPISGGYYQIRNVNSGKMVNVAGGSGINGAKILQWPAGSILPGNDLWEPVQNPDGTYSFYNLNSLQALDNPGGSAASGTQLDQWFDNSTPAQKFNLIPQ